MPASGCATRKIRGSNQDTTDASLESGRPSGNRAFCGYRPLDRQAKHQNVAISVLRLASATEDYFATRFRNQACSRRGSSSPFNSLNPHRAHRTSETPQAHRPPEGQRRSPKPPSFGGRYGRECLKRPIAAAGLYDLLVHCPYSRRAPSSALTDRKPGDSIDLAIRSHALTNRVARRAKYRSNRNKIGGKTTKYNSSIGSPPC